MSNEESLPIQYTQRIRNQETAEKFEELQNELDKRNRQYGNQNTGLFAIKLAHKKLKELKEKERDVEDCMP